MSALQFAIPAGTQVAALTDSQRSLLLRRGRATDPAVIRTVAGIIDTVRERGDDALKEYAKRFDRVELETLEVPRSEWQRALEQLDPAVRTALEEAADAIRAFHASQLPIGSEVELRRGVKLGRRAEPLASVGVYAPGGRAAYPSSVLMGAVPARVAGVGLVVLGSPPGPNGLPPDAVLAAAAIAGVDRVFAVGGAGAIAALAYGTASIPRVDKIVGPGNAYVSEAKRQLTGQVAIDSPAGPSELLIIADDSADARLVALELIAQAEHDPDASVVLASTSAALIRATEERLLRDLKSAPRAAVITAALQAGGALLLAADERELIDFTRDYAPEHLLVLTHEPRALLPEIRAAGTVFLGPHSSVAFGDYITGANHVLPTAGLARAYAGLSTADFVRWYTYQEVDARAAAQLSAPTAVLADAEGLPGHAAAARARANGDARIQSPPILRTAYREINLYDPKRSPCEVDLSDNTNLFGVAPAARALLMAPADAQVTRYPAVFAGRLKQAIADWHGIEPDNVTTGCGSDDVIDSALRAFCERNDIVVSAAPTFSMVAAFAHMNALQPLDVPAALNGSLDVERLVQSRGRATYVCRPNNPTGSVAPRADIEALADRVPGVLLIDEAYASYADDDLGDYAVRSERVISLRTFSKAFGLAGLRIGYALGPAQLIYEIEKSRGPYKVNAIAEAAAIAVLERDRDWFNEIVEQTRTNRQRLFEQLVQLGYAPLSSGANFLCVPLRDTTAAEMAATLRNQGVAVRPFAALSGIGECIRVTVGPWSMMERFLAAMAAV